MIIYKTEMVEEKVVDVFVCDLCQTVIDDPMELQEACSLDFIGGYNSVFGDESEVTCDLCQHCLKDLIGKFCIYHD